jgi:hypothetical protein
MATVYHIRLPTMRAGTAAPPVMQDKKPSANSKGSEHAA